MGIGDKIKEKRIELGYSQEYLAEKMGYTNRSSINKIELGKNDVPRSKIIKFAEVLNTTVAYLMDWEENVSIPLPEQTEVLIIKVYNPLSCGTGMFVDDNAIGEITVPKSMLPRGNKDLFAQYAEGDSMTGSDINDGDLLIFSKQQCESGDIGCFCIGENIATCKKLKIVGNVIMLLPSNDRYEPIIVEPEQFKCIGKLVLKINKV